MRLFTEGFIDRCVLKKYFCAPNLPLPAYLKRNFGNGYDFLIDKRLHEEHKLKEIAWTEYKEKHGIHDEH